MKKFIFTMVLAVASVAMATAQNMIQQGTLDKDIAWTFDGMKLTLTNIQKKGEPVEMPNFDERNVAPWTKKKLKVQIVTIGSGITSIGSCAFSNSAYLTDVIFESNDVTEIGWGAFLGCKQLRTISFPQNLAVIGTAAFAKCKSLPAISIPNKCRVEDMAFLSCSGLSQISIATNATLGSDVFAIEVDNGRTVQHIPSKAAVSKIPPYITEGNCTQYGLSVDQVLKLTNREQAAKVNYDEQTSDVDASIPTSTRSHNETYALIIGNQNYRFATNVPYAIHDSRVFSEYCNKALGIPTSNIHQIEDATKMMIWEEEMQWLSSIPEAEDKNLIVYYAGHGVPDTKNSNKAYLLPTDVRGAKPQFGIPLDDFYAKLGSFNFAQCSVFLDACFSGSNRMNNGVVEGLRDVEIVAEEGELTTGNVVVFSAAQGNETAQGYDKEGHGLFTYYLLKSIQDSNGSPTLGTMSDYIEKNVSTTALTLKLRKPQTPTIKASGKLADNWRRVGIQ